MLIDSELVSHLNKEGQSYTILVEGRQFAVSGFRLSKTEIPVNKPTTRGGVYFSDRQGFCIWAEIKDGDIANILSKTMLGPNTEFKEVVFLTNLEKQGQAKQLQIAGNLTWYVQKKDCIQLNVMVTEIKSSN